MAACYLWFMVHGSWFMAVWLTQQQMAELFNTTRNNITLHIGNIFKEGELEVNSVRKESLLTAADGKKYRTKFYNLDVIISVGYRFKNGEL